MPPKLWNEQIATFRTQESIEIPQLVTSMPDALGRVVGGKNVELVFLDLARAAELRWNTASANQLLHNYVSVLQANANSGKANVVIADATGVRTLPPGIVANKARDVQELILWNEIIS